MPNRVIFDEKETMIITVKYIVIVAILIICSVQTCIQTFHYCLYNRRLGSTLPFMAWNFTQSYQMCQIKRIKFMTYYKFESVEPN